MSTQSIAVETMVVSELQGLFEAEHALETMYNGLRHNSSGSLRTSDFLTRLSDLDERAKRLERMLETLDAEEGNTVRAATC